ncbi:hypothetical protein MHC_01385 [Mycoplasma haemocanis str. Illinois]|uniref:Uncharacterized protein n=1 Tax=Mycoplasma haemocanis (strain Illinois) TaxID=1111676 RepID=H6N671_MYCHN|nr:hypothetical protein [Mycoplasma haemocanis]AEW45143.1 hypothetical protein MHC_01385 [Mycoplasma haemocanis str. Illinois]
MNVLKIGAISVTSVGGISVSVALAKHLSSGTSIKSVSDKLKEEHFTPITEESDWNKMLTKYNQQKNEVDGRFTSKNEDVKIEELKSSCKEILSEDSVNSKNYAKARRWCTIPKTLSNLLTSHKLTLLNTNDGNESSKGDWEKLQKAYETSSDNRITGLDLGSVANDKWKKLKAKCKEISEKDSTEVNFETLFSNLKKWCIKEESDRLNS